MSDKPVAVLTGGSAGIGLSILHHLLESGYQVINLSRRRAPLEDGAITNIELDLTDRDALGEACKVLAERGAQTFIHNAGVIHPALVEEVDLADLDTLNQLHLGAGVQIMQAMIPSMRRAQFGRVVIISSRASVGMPTRTSYSATKAGQIAMARTWALELAADGITVNTVAPGPIRATEMFHAVVPENSDMEEQMAQKIPVHRLGLPEDVARAVMFFLDPMNSFVTGQNLFVCGGTSIGSI